MISLQAKTRAPLRAQRPKDFSVSRLPPRHQQYQRRRTSSYKDFWLIVAGDFYEFYDSEAGADKRAAGRAADLCHPGGLGRWRQRRRRWNCGSAGFTGLPCDAVNRGLAAVGIRRAVRSGFRVEAWQLPAFRAAHLAG